MKPSDLEKYRSNASQQKTERKGASASLDRKKEGMIESTLMFQKHYQVSMMVGLIIISTVGVLGYLGHRLDLLLDTKNTFMVIGLIFSFPISQFALYKWIKEKYIPSVKKRHNKNK